MKKEKKKEIKWKFKYLKWLSEFGGCCGIKVIRNLDLQPTAPKFPKFRGRLYRDENSWAYSTEYLKWRDSENAYYRKYDKMKPKLSDYQGAIKNLTSRCISRGLGNGARLFCITITDKDKTNFEFMSNCFLENGWKCIAKTKSRMRRGRGRYFIYMFALDRNTEEDKRAMSCV